MRIGGFIYLMGELVDLYTSWENWWRSLETCRVIFTRSLHSTRGCVGCDDVHLVFVISLPGPCVLSTRGLGCDHCEHFHQVFVMCLPCPYTVPEGVTVLLFTSALHRDERWFPDPDLFDPDRFLPENSTHRHPFSYIPFSAGLRNCIGGVVCACVSVCVCV